MEEKAEKQKIATEAIKALSEIEDTLELENIIKDNTIEFEIKDIKYRVRKPNHSEITEIETARRKKYIELISDDSYLFKKQWIEKYKKKDIDIDAMERKLHTLQSEIEQLLLQLAKNKIPNDIEKLKKEINKLRTDQFELSMEITDLLNYSIENQLLIFVNSYTTWLVLEKLVGDTWMLVYDKYENFTNSKDSALLNKAFYYIGHLIYTV